jgi:hypothetical protein
MLQHNLIRDKGVTLIFSKRGGRLHAFRFHIPSGLKIQTEQSDHIVTIDVILHLQMDHAARQRRRTRRRRTVEPESDHATGMANLSV